MCSHVKLQEKYYSCVFGHFSHDDLSRDLHQSLMNVCVCYMNTGADLVYRYCRTPFTNTCKHLAFVFSVSMYNTVDPAVVSGVYCLWLQTSPGSQVNTLIYFTFQAWRCDACPGMKLQLKIQSRQLPDRCLLMCSSQQRWETSKMNHSLATSVNVSVS